MHGRRALVATEMIEGDVNMDGRDLGNLNSWIEMFDDYRVGLQNDTGVRHKAERLADL